MTLYLLPDLNRSYGPSCGGSSRSARVVSHAFDMGDEWPPERTERVQNSTLYAWTIRPEHKKA